MSWMYLILAIAFEVVGTTMLKDTSHVIGWKTLAMLSSYATSLFFLSLALKKMDIGVAYAIWSGLGITAIQIIGLLFFRERIDFSKGIFISLILIGTIGLNFTRTG